MQDGRAWLPAVPAGVLETTPPSTPGPMPGDWRIAELALEGVSGEPGWVALRIEPFEVLPLVEDRETAEVLAAMRARREGVAVWVWVDDESRFRALEDTV